MLQDHMPSYEVVGRVKRELKHAPFFRLEGLSRAPVFWRSGRREVELQNKPFHAPRPDSVGAAEAAAFRIRISAPLRAKETSSMS